MTYIARLLLCSTLFLSPVGSTLAAAADEQLGVLVVAHGSTAAWNTNVEAVVTIIQQHMPSKAAYLMGAKNRTPQEAYDELVAAGVQRIVVVPLLVSSYSLHYEQVRFIGRLRDEYSGSERMELTPLHGPADVVGVTPALDVDPILAGILSDRARALSRDPSTESLVIVAHGPNGAADADRWMDVIRELGVQIQSLVPFKEVDVRLLRDDAPTPVKEQALAELRHSVANRAASGRVVVVPLLLGPGRLVEALLHGSEQIADLPVPVAESPGAVRIGHPERGHLVEYLAPNSVFNSLPRQRSSPHLRPDDRLVTIDRVFHHASLGAA